MFGQGLDPGLSVQDLSGQSGQVPDLNSVLDSMGVSSSGSGSLPGTSGGMLPESSLLPSIDSSLSSSSGSRGDQFGMGFTSGSGGFGPGPTDLRLESRAGTGARSGGSLDAARGAPLDATLPRDLRPPVGGLGAAGGFSGPGGFSGAGGIPGAGGVPGAGARDPRMSNDPRVPDFRDPRFMMDPRFGADPRLGMDPRFPVDPRDPRAALGARDPRGSRMTGDPRMAMDPRMMDPRASRFDPRADMFPGSLDRRPVMGFDAMGRPIFMDSGFGAPSMDPRLAGSSFPDARFGAGSAASRLPASAGAGGFPVGGMGSFPSSASGLPAGGLPSGGLPSGGFPAGGLPTGGLPSGSMPTGGFPSGGFPSGGFPSGGFPAGGFPTGGFPAGGVVGNGTLPPLDPRMGMGFDTRRFPVDPRFGPTRPMVDPRFAGYPPYNGFPGKIRIIRFDYSNVKV